eukprot:TRINITY_DN2163_c0_g1_i4.p1 TRINITY_DN2163_c0_g1~~TRINITY_DN2163_c0_g1_i4.p1  ORF type:complete len:222 (-),score=85.67 TRINITY_DN2163_c0_g1_i4:180-845(-)
MLRSLVGSEMCIRDRYQRRVHGGRKPFKKMSRLATLLLKSRVIPLAHQLEKTMHTMVRADFENYETPFLEEDAMNFYQAQFYTFALRRWRIDESLFSKTELEAFRAAQEKLERFRELHDFLENMHQFVWETRTLYFHITRQLFSSNFWWRRPSTTHAFEEDVDESLKKFAGILEELKDNPEWLMKVKNEGGIYLHLIYNSLCVDDRFKTIFEKIDPHFYFK